MNTSLVFLRHAKPLPHVDDKMRSLCQEGRTQAKRVGATLKARGKTFDLIITSSALRTIETAKEIAKQWDKMPPMVEIEAFYQPIDHQDRKGLGKMLQLFGAKALEFYREHGLDTIWERYEDTAFHAILQVLELYKSNRVLIVGHGNIINALGLRFAPGADVLNKTYFSYCEGFEIQDGVLVNLL